MYLALGEGSTAGADLLASRDRAFHEGEALLARAGQRLQQAGFNTSQLVVPGEARESIIAAAADWHPDLDRDRIARLDGARSRSPRQCVGLGGPPRHVLRGGGMSHHTAAGS